MNYPHTVTVLDREGRPVSGAGVTVKDSQNVAIAIYNSGGVELSSPVTGVNGSLTFYAPAGIYNIYISRNGFPDEIMPGEIIGELGSGAYLLATVSPPANPIEGQVWFPLPDTSDSTPPTIVTFTTGSAEGLTVPVTFSATDNVGVTGYIITESSTPPTVGQSGWNVSAPTSYTAASAGTKTLYPWAKDASGNISAVFPTPRQVTFSAAPTIYTFTGANGAAIDSNVFGANVLSELNGGAQTVVGLVTDIQSNKGRLRLGSSVSGLGVGVSKKYLVADIDYSVAKKTIEWQMSGVINQGESGFFGPACAMVLTSVDYASGPNGAYGNGQNECRVVSVGGSSTQSNIYLQARVSGSQVYSQPFTHNGSLGDMVSCKLEISPSSPTLKLFINSVNVLTTGSIALPTTLKLYMAATTGCSTVNEVFFDNVQVY